MPAIRLPSRRAVCRALTGAGAGFLASPAGAETWAGGGMADFIVVLKTERKVMLARAGRVLKTYPIALGEHPRGPKRERGDGRTPEGLYRIDGFNPQSRYHRALHISYPNADDLRRARLTGRPPGGDIEIHGMPEGYGDIDPTVFSRDWTDGCIGVSNRAIDEIWARVSIDTAVQIMA